MAAWRGCWVPGHICDRAPTSPAPCPLCVHIVWTDGRYSKTPQATEAISKRPVKPSTGSREEWERRTKRCWKIFNFSITVATNQKPQEVLLDFKPSVTFKSKPASWSVCNWIDLLQSSFGVPLLSVGIYFAKVTGCSLYVRTPPDCKSKWQESNLKTWHILSPSVPSIKCLITL